MGHGRFGRLAVPLWLNKGLDALGFGLLRIFSIGETFLGFPIKSLSRSNVAFEFIVFRSQVPKMVPMLGGLCDIQFQLFVLDIIDYAACLLGFSLGRGVMLIWVVFDFSDITFCGRTDAGM